jgi:hypothetical protein
MSCSPLIHPSCITPRLVAPAAGSVANGFLNGLANGVAKAVRWSLVDAATLWVHIPSPDLGSAPVTDIQGWLLPITAAVAVGAMITAGVRMALTRRANPLLDVSGGLLTLAAAVVLGVVLPELLLQAGDAWSAWVLRISTGGHFTQRITTLLDFTHQTASVVIILFGILAVIVALIQAVLILFRQLALVVLAGVLPLAAAGSMAPLTRPWIRKISSWMLALIFYKPAAAAVYATAFTLIGSGKTSTSVLLGFVALLLSVLALPALMRLFTWATGAVSNPGGGQFLGAAALGAVAIGALRSGSGGGAASAAQGQASYLNTQLGPPPGSGPPPGPSGSGGSSGPLTPPPGSGPSPAASTPPPPPPPPG